MSADPGSAEPAPEARAAPEHEDGEVTAVYEVTIAAGARGVLIGGSSTQVNIGHLHVATWTDGVAPEPLVTSLGEVKSPYRGLDAFGEADAGLFFGRDTAIDGVLGRLADCAAGAGLLVLSGVSGAGKTSLLQAGILPRLREQGLPGLPEAATWPRVVLVPGAHPLEQLAVAIAPAAGADAGAVSRSLDESAAGFALTARQAAAATGSARVLLVVDQFETALTQCERPDERAAFITALDAAVSSQAAVVVIAIRADLEAKLADYPDFPALQAATQDRYLLGAMTERQLRLAITQPAVAAGASVDEDLVAELLRTVRAHADRAGGDRGPIGAGVLPLLSHALDQAWRLRSDKRDSGGGFRPLTLADYEATGGIERAVQDSAQAVYEGLTGAQQRVARQVFTRLTATSPEGIDTAVRASTAELLAGRDESGAADLTEVLRAFADQRLLTLAAGSVEISHEVLLSAWPLLRDDWLAGTRADRAARARLAATVTDWLNAGRDRSFLYTGRRLDSESQAARRIAADERHAPLSEDELAFLAASRRARTRAAQVRRGSIAGGALLAAGLAVALVIATQSAIGYLRERGSARAAQRSAAAAQGSAAAARNTAAAAQQLHLSDEDASQSLSLESRDPQQAQTTAVRSWQLAQTPQSRYALVAAASNPLTALISDGATAVSVAVSPNGATLAVGYDEPDNSWVQLYDARTGAPVGGKLTTPGLTTVLPAEPLPSVPDYLPGSSPGSFIPSHPIPASTMTMPPVLAQSGTGHYMLPLAFSPDGRTLAVGAGDSMALWNVATGHTSHTWASFPFTAISAIDSVAFSPDGKTLLVGGQSCGGQSAGTGCAELWNAATGRVLGAPLDADAHTLLTQVIAAISPDGSTVATAGSDGTIRLWSTVTHHQVRPAFPAQRAGIEALAFSPQGGILASGGDDGTIRLWNTATGAQIRRPLTAARGDGGQVNAVAFSHDGTLVADADENGTVQVWKVATGTQVGPDLPGGTDTDTAVAFSPDGSTLTSVNADGTARLWRLAALQGRPAAPPIPTGAGVAGDGMGDVTLGPSSSLVTTDEDGNISVWVSTGGTQQAFPVMMSSNPPISSGDPTYPPHLALSPDGRRLVTGGDNGTIQLWNLSSPRFATRPIMTIPVPETVDGGNISMAGGIAWLAFSPDGSQFAAAYIDGSLQVFNTATGQPTGDSISGAAYAGSMLALAFAPGGDLITVDSTGSVTTWNPHASDFLDDLVTSTSVSFASEPHAVAVSPDGQTLAAGYADGTVQLWDIATNLQIGNPISTGDGGVASLAFSPDGTRLASAGDDGTVRLWDVSYLSPARDVSQLGG